MKKFSFRLEKVLGYRRSLENERRRAFALAAGILRRREEDMQRLADETNGYRTRLAEMGVGRISARELALTRSYLTHLELRLAEAAKWLQEARIAVENRREDLVKASKDTKVIEKVREHQKARYDYAVGREEGKVLDEIGTNNFILAKAADVAEAQV